jgi:hypothetical protein
MRKKPHRSNKPLKRTRLRRESPTHARERKRFREQCFALYGDRCFFCGWKATDTMHIIPRRFLNKRQRYAAPSLNARPGCRRCHGDQEAGRLHFPDHLIEGALIALRGLGSVKDPRTGMTYGANE